MRSLPLNPASAASCAATESARCLTRVDSSSISTASGCADASALSSTASTLVSTVPRWRPNSASWRARSAELREIEAIWSLTSARSRERAATAL